MPPSTSPRTTSLHRDVPTTTTVISNSRTPPPPSRLPHHLHLHLVTINTIVTTSSLPSPSCTTTRVHEVLLNPKQGLVWGCDIAALIDVNAAQSKLVLLENFNENYSKLLYKVNAAEGVNAASKEVSTAELIVDSDLSGSFDAGHDGRKNKDDSHSTKKRRICSELQQQEAWQSL
ncbi:hypothetical protein Tco_0494726 [Tanacetum coccineum]